MSGAQSAPYGSGFRGSGGSSQQPGGAFAADGGVRVRGAEGAFEDVEGAAVEGGGFVEMGDVVGGGEEGGEVVEGEAEVGVVRPEDGLLDLRGSPVETLGFGGVAVRLADGGEVVQVDGDLVVLRTVDALEDGDRLGVEVLGFGVLPLSVEERGESGFVGGGVGMVGAEGFLADLDRAPRKGLAALRVLDPASCVLQAAQVVPEARGLEMIFSIGFFEQREGPAVERLGFLPRARRTETSAVARWPRSSWMRASAISTLATSI